MRVRRSLAAAGALVTGAALLALPAAPVAAGPAPVAAGKAPSKVVLIVLDQLRPEFIRTFGMKNVQALMRGGASYRNAYLGHMASETVVSHNVMTSG